MGVNLKKWAARRRGKHRRSWDPHSPAYRPCIQWYKVQLSWPVVIGLFRRTRTLYVQAASTYAAQQRVMQKFHCVDTVDRWAKRIGLAAIETIDSVRHTQIPWYAKRYPLPRL